MSAEMVIRGTRKMTKLMLVENDGNELIITIIMKMMMVKIITMMTTVATFFVDVDNEDDISGGLG